MTKHAPAIAALVFVSCLGWSVPALAQMGQAYVGENEETRSLTPGAQAPLEKAGQMDVPAGDGEETARAAPGGNAPEKPGSFTMLTRMADGKVMRSAPGEELRGAFSGRAKRQAEPDAVQLSAVEDPSFLSGETARQVFGADDRVQVLNTKVYPFKAFGYIEAASGAGKGSCSGTLIGPRTVLTAAHCIYSHEEKGWLSDIRFAPGLNGLDTAPFGIYEAQSTSILEGFVDNYQGHYASVVPWDLGIITLAEPVGDTLGWLGYANYEGLGDFTANIVGYPGDKDPPALMWRVNCEVPAKNVAEANFDYECDTYPGSSGSAVYAYDDQLKQRVIVGVNIAENTEFNTAVRLTAPTVAWINSLWK